MKQGETVVMPSADPASTRRARPPIWAVGLLGVAIAVVVSAATTAAVLWDNRLWIRVLEPEDFGNPDANAAVVDMFRLTVGDAFTFTVPWVLGVLAATVLVAAVTAVRAGDGRRTWTFATVGSVAWFAWCALAWRSPQLTLGWPFGVEWPVHSGLRAPAPGEPTWLPLLPGLVEVLVVPAALLLGAWLGAQVRSARPPRPPEVRPSRRSVVIAAVSVGGAAAVSGAGGVLARDAGDRGVVMADGFVLVEPELGLLLAIILAAALLSGSGARLAGSSRWSGLALLAAWYMWFGPEINRWYDGGADGLLVHVMSVLVVTALVWAWRPLVTALDRLVAPPT